MNAFDASRSGPLLDAVYDQLRAIAQQFNCAVVTAHQVNRQGAQARTVTSAHTSESFAVNMDADLVLTYSQEDEVERPHGLARLFVDKNRHGDAKFFAGDNH